MSKENSEELKDFHREHYSKELDDELKLLLQEFRDGNLSVKDLLRLVDAACRDHMDFEMMGTPNSLYQFRQNEKK